MGKRETEDSAEQAFDHKTGAAAVVRNLQHVLGGTGPAFRLVIIDRFYSSVALAIQLLTMSIYVIGTIMTNRLGYDRRVVESRKTRPRAIERGQFTFSRCEAVPTMVACHWWDRKPVHYLATGVALVEDKINRNVKGMGQLTVKCPRLVTDYQRWMGGVDVHDQLRLQTYSIQTSFRFRKYYKSLFLGFLDLALVNAFISHKEASRLKNVPVMSRGEWYSVLHQQLLKVTDADFDAETATPSPAVRQRKRRRLGAHVLAQNEDWIAHGEIQKRRQRACKVCGLLRGEAKKSFQTTFYCEACSVDEAKCYLCPKVRRVYNGESKTCFQIWHEDFVNGTTIPAHLGKRVVMRRARASGDRKKTRREILCEDEEETKDEGPQAIV